MRQVAVGIVVKNGQVLACQRKRTARFPLKWEFPGGKIEHNETPEDAIVRELLEELAIEATIDCEFHRQEWVYSEGTDNARSDDAFAVRYFLIRQYRGEPVNHAFEDTRWVTPSELLRMDILEGNREAIELLAKHAGNKQTT